MRNNLIAVTLGHNWGDALRAAGNKIGNVVGIDRDQPCDVTVYIRTSKTVRTVEDELRAELQCDYICVENVPPESEYRMLSR